MAPFDKGLSANNKPSSGQSGGELGALSQVVSIQGDVIQIGRVLDIILDSNYPNIEQFGGLNGIGTIRFALNTKYSSASGVAKPLLPQISSYPVINEMVLLFNCPSNNIGKNPDDKDYYYISVVNLWNHPHHNAYPEINQDTLPPEQQIDYQLADAGVIRRVGDKDKKDQSTEIDLNSPTNPSQKTFIERSNIHPLLPFAGDVIYQGRWGNSIRLGSTANPPFSPPLNDWSEVGENGDPITIIRNGQNPNGPSEKEKDQGWVPTTEDINNDLSSIFLTSNQKIPLKPINDNYNTYSPVIPFKKYEPTHPSQYVGPQVIINSDRLVFNAKKDSILLSAQDSIFLGTNLSLNFTTKSFKVDANSIELGIGATEPIIRGDRFLDDFKVILTEFKHLLGELKKLQTVSAVDPNSGKISYTSAVDGLISFYCKNLIDQLNDTFIPRIDSAGGYKSQTSKTL